MKFEEILKISRSRSKEKKQNKWKFLILGPGRLAWILIVYTLSHWVLHWVPLEMVACAPEVSSWKRLRTSEEALFTRTWNSMSGKRKEDNLYLRKTRISHPQLQVPWEKGSQNLKKLSWNGTIPWEFFWDSNRFLIIGLFFISWRICF